MDLTEFLCEYTTVGSSSLISVSGTSTDRSWKICGTLMSHTPLFKEEISELLASAFLLALDIVGLSILDSIISRVREYH